MSLYPSCTYFKQHYFISSLIILNYPSLLHQTTTWSIIAKIQDCLSDLDEWMFLNKLKLNKDKTVVLFFYSIHCPISLYHHFVLEVIQIIHSILPETFDSTMSMLSHVNLVCKSAFYHLRYISLIKNSYLQRLARFSSMLLYPLSLTAATRFCIMCRSMF